MCVVVGLVARTARESRVTVVTRFQDFYMMVFGRRLCRVCRARFHASTHRHTLVAHLRAHVKRGDIAYDARRRTWRVIDEAA